MADDFKPQHPLTIRGYDPRKPVYLPPERDPLNMGEKSSTFGLSLPHGGHRWEDFKDDELYGKAATAMSDWIDENYAGEDREYMQQHAFYVNSVTKDPEHSYNKNVIRHEYIGRASCREIV